MRSPATTGGDRQLTKAAAITPRPETLGLLADLEARTGDARPRPPTPRRSTRSSSSAGRRRGCSTARSPGSTSITGTRRAAVSDRLVAAAKIRPDAAGLDLEAWAAFRLGDLGRPVPRATWRSATGSVDARILYHAGAIRIAAGDRAGGLALVRRAVDLGPALDPFDRAGAEALLAG